MSSENKAQRDRLTRWLVGGSLALAAALAVVAVVWSWPAQVVANALQLLGIALTALGVAVVRSWLELARDKAIDAKHGLDRWSAIRREQLRRLWARLRKRPVLVHLHGLSVAQSSDAAVELTVQRRRVDRDTISDREWLAFLDNRGESILKLMDQAERNRSAERENLNRRLHAQRDQLRAEIRRETRQGWELIVAGLVWSAIGTAVGIFG